MHRTDLEIVPLTPIAQFAEESGLDAQGDKGLALLRTLGEFFVQPACIMFIVQAF